jgi:hypothetical protein
MPMKSGNLQIAKTKAAWLLGLAVVIAGFACVLVFVCQSLVGVALLPDVLPTFPSAWLDASAARLPLPLRNWVPRTLPPGFALALVALGTMMLGAALARRQIVLLEELQREKADRLRRVQQYAGEVDSDGRVEPYIGATVIVDAEIVEPRQKIVSSC